MNLKKLLTIAALTGFSASVATGQGTAPTIVQGDYITNVFGQSNFIKNPNAKLNTKDVAVSTATVTRSPTTPLVATSEFNVTITSANGTVTWDARAFDAGMKNQNCEARFTYRGFQSTSKVQIKQSTNVVAELALTASTDPRIASINFPCGDLSQLTKFVVTDTSTLSGVNEIGGIYVGLATNQANVAQAEVLVSAGRITSGQSIPFATQTRVIFNSESYDQNNEYDTSTGIYTAKKAGRYFVRTNILYDLDAWTAGNELEVYARKNGNAVCVSNKRVEATISTYLNIQTQCFIDANQGDTLDIAVYQARSTSATAIVYQSPTLTQFQISRFPTSSELVVTPERQNWFVDGYHTGNNPSLGTVAVATRTEITNATMTFTPKTGSAPVATLCSSTNPPPALSTSTTTCAAGNESMGITFNIPTAGIYKVCTEFQPNINVAAASEVDLYMFLEETATNANTALTTNRSVNRYFTATSTANNMTTPIRMCENFNFASVGQKAIRIMYQQTVAGTVNSAVIVADNYKERGIKWTVEPYDNQSNSALYVQGPVKAAETGAAIPAGYVGEMKQSTVSFTNINLAAYTNLNTVTLSPGVWSCSSQARIARNGATVPASFEFVSCVGNSTSGNCDLGYAIQTIGNSYQSGITNTFNYLQVGSQPTIVRYDGSNFFFADGTISASATGVIAQKIYLDATAGTPQALGRLECVRIN